MANELTVQDVINRYADQLNDCARYDNGCSDTLLQIGNPGIMDYFLDWYSWIVLGPIMLLVIGALASVIVFTKEKEVAVIMASFGTKFNSIKETGISFKMPWPIYTIKEYVSLKQFEIADDLEVKTKDGTYVKLPVSVQIKRIKEKIYEAVFALEQPLPQISSYILKAIKNAAADMTLDELFVDKDEIKNSVIKNLATQLAEKYGFEIVDILVDEPVPPMAVQEQSNNVVAQQKAQVAAEHEGEAKKIKARKRAEAEQISMKGKGKATVAMREEYLKGLKQHMQELRDAFPGLDDHSINGVLERIDLRDTLRDVGERGGVVVANVGGDAGDDPTAKVAALVNAMKKQLTSEMPPVKKVEPEEKKG